MSEPEALLTEHQIRRRSRRFASLRAAQRILSHSGHLSELEATFAQGREVVLGLQELGALLKGASGAVEATPAERERLRRADEQLDAISERTRSLLDQTSIAEMRTQLEQLSREHPEEIRGLIDTILEGDVESDRNLRLIEYLVTLLSSEDRDSRRSVTRKLSDVAPRIAEFAREHLAGTGDALHAEAMFSNATQRLFQEDDVGAIRDRIREFKQELGSGILHPRVLASAVDYNVAMWNRVEGLMEGSRLLDRLADDLLAPDRPVSHSGESTPAPSIQESPVFGRLVSAVAARVKGASPGEGAVERFAGSFDLGGLSASEVEAFETGDEAAGTRVARAAVTLYLARLHADSESELLHIGLDPELLEGPWRDELMEEATAAAQKLLTDGRFADACRLSEIRAKNLGMPPRLAQGEGEPVRISPAESRTRSGPSLGKIVAAIAAVFWLAWMGNMISSVGGAEAVAEETLAAISPHLASGYRSEEGAVSRFVGTLNTSWDGLDAEARRLAAEAMGADLADRGVESVVLLDRFQRVQVNYAFGQLLTAASPVEGSR
jgi:hypothetical protein